MRYFRRQQETQIVPEFQNSQCNIIFVLKTTGPCQSCDVRDLFLTVLYSFFAHCRGFTYMLSMSSPFDWQWLSWLTPSLWRWFDCLWYKTIRTWSDGDAQFKKTLKEQWLRKSNIEKSELLSGFEHGKILAALLLTSFFQRIGIFVNYWGKPNRHLILMNSIRGGLPLDVMITTTSIQSCWLKRRAWGT